MAANTQVRDLAYFRYEQVGLFSPILKMDYIFTYLYYVIVS
jgi:hypothetical protein